MRFILIGLLVATTVTACGRQPGTRAATGGALGAGGGVALGIATGGIAPAVGALVGGGVGAAGAAGLPKRKQASPVAIREPVVHQHASGPP